MSETISVHNMFSPCSAKRRASDKDLPACRAEILEIFSLHFGRNDDLIQIIDKKLEKLPGLLHDLKQFLLRQNLVSLAEHGL